MYVRSLREEPYLVFVDCQQKYGLYFLFLALYYYCFYRACPNAVLAVPLSGALVPIVYVQKMQDHVIINVVRGKLGNVGTPRI
jgi:hypothetical protein